MSQFGKILKFELGGYFKNKVFIGITVFLIAAIAILMFIPNVISLFSDGTTDTEIPDSGYYPDGGSTEPPSDTDGAPVMLIRAEDSELRKLVSDAFGNAFLDFYVKPFSGTVDEMKAEILAGSAECAFDMESISSYTYFVNNLSMYDMNTAIADEVLTEIYRVTLMVQNGVAPEDAAEILGVYISGSTETLGKDQMQNFFYTYIMIFALYMVILLYGQMVATNVATEKSSRAMELLVTSADPTSMMFGKVVASCIAGLTQLVLVFGSALLFYGINKAAWGGNVIIESLFAIPLDLFIFMLVFFVLGFLTYAFLYGAIGSTASKLEDINTSVMPITFLFIFGFFVVIFSMTGGEIDNMMMKICSYIPFTSPMAMFTRIAMSTVPWYEILISILILIGSVIGIGVLAARIYRAGVLLYGTPPKFTTIIKTVFRKQSPAPKKGN